jgi:pyrroline-5-carboxylate reductase
VFETRKISFIGPGVMAEAMIAGIIRQEVATAESLIAAGPRLERLVEQPRKRMSSS